VLYPRAWAIHLTDVECFIAFTSATTHRDNFESVSGLAYGAIKDYLKQKNMATVDDLVNDVIKTMTQEQQDRVLQVSALPRIGSLSSLSTSYSIRRQRMKELGPKGLVDTLFQPRYVLMVAMK
jgi:hypothetical protein